VLIFYRSDNGQFTWRLRRSGNHRGLVTPNESFVEKRGALGNFDATCDELGVTRKRRTEMLASARYDWDA